MKNFKENFNFNQLMLDSKTVAIHIILYSIVSLLINYLDILPDDLPLTVRFFIKFVTYGILLFIAAIIWTIISILIERYKNQL